MNSLRLLSLTALLTAGTAMGAMAATGTSSTTGTSMPQSGSTYSSPSTIATGTTGTRSQYGQAMPGQQPGSTRHTNTSVVPQTKPNGGYAPSGCRMPPRGVAACSFRTESVAGSTSFNSTS
jgi:hypothetical protein